MAQSAYDLALPGGLQDERIGYKPFLWNMVLFAGALFLGNQVIAATPLLRIAAALALVVAFGVPAVENPKRAMYMLFIFLPFLGIIRRLIVGDAGRGALDPLLLVSSAVIILIFFTLLVTKRANLDGTWLSRFVFYLLMIGLLQVFNPAQGNLLVGFTGIMFLLVPMATFFIGRSIADEQIIAKLQKYMIAVGIIAGGYGLYQVLVGFPSFEKAYLAKAGFGALYVGTAIRPMSIFTNPLEYSTYLGFCIMTALSFFLYTKRISKIWLLGAIAVMAYAGYLIGSRGFVVTAVLGAIIMIGSKARNAFVALLLVASMIGGILFWTSTKSSQNISIDQTTSQAAQLAARQKIALYDPLDPRRSTLTAHYHGVVEGLTFAFTQVPFGLGTGSTGRGSSKFGGAKSSSTELDVSDAAIAFGALGGILYMAIIVLAGWQLFKMRLLFKGPMWPAVLGMAIVSAGQWLNGGNYAVAPLIWFMLGAADNAYMKRRAQIAAGETIDDEIDPAAQPAH